MIIKSFELQKINLIKYNFLLFYGKNEGLKTEAINKLSSNQNQNYDEDEILKNKDSFIENLLSKSFFDNQKIIVIKRATDKLVNIRWHNERATLSETNKKHIKNDSIRVYRQALRNKEISIFYRMIGYLRFVLKPWIYREFFGFNAKF